MSSQLSPISFWFVSRSGTPCPAVSGLVLATLVPHATFIVSTWECYVHLCPVLGFIIKFSALLRLSCLFGAWGWHVRLPSWVSMDLFSISCHLFSVSHSSVPCPPSLLLCRGMSASSSRLGSHVLVSLLGCDVQAGSLIFQCALDKVCLSLPFGSIFLARVDDILVVAFEPIHWILLVRVCMWS